MPVARTNIINFFRKKISVNILLFIKSLQVPWMDVVFLRRHTARASTTSLLYFSVVETEEGAQEILRRANEWRKKYDFKVDVITFDGEILYEYGKLKN